MKLRLANWLRMGLGIPRHRIRCTTRSGNVMETDPRELVQREILYTGFYEGKTSTCLLNTLKLGDVFFDTGAHVGYYTLAGASKVGPTGKVFAIEPNPQTFLQLRENIKLNPELKNISLLLGAASEKAGLVDMSWPPSGNWGQSKVTSSAGSAYAVPCISLVQLLGHWNISQVDTLKLDAEGHELPILKGLCTHIKPAHIFFEVNDAKAEQAREIMAYLTSLNYDLKLVDGRPYQAEIEIPENNLWASLAHS